MDWEFESVSARILLGVSSIQWLYGMLTCVYLYGRKVDLAEDAADAEDESTTSSEEEEEGNYDHQE